MEYMFGLKKIDICNVLKKQGLQFVCDCVF
jgi:hypothetical protein